MPNFMRYVAIEDSRLSLRTVERGLTQHDDRYRLVVSETGQVPQADIKYDGGDLCSLWILRPDQVDYKSDLSHMKKALESVEDCQERKHVSKILDHARAIIKIRVFWGEREVEELTDLLDPLYGFCYQHWEGLLQSDDDGWHDPFGLVLEIPQ